MKLVATTETVKIQWFAVMHDGSKIRNNKGFIHNAWDVKCSCGWESKTGGAIKACVKDIVENHKWDAHNYAYKLSDLEEVKELNLGAGQA
jgi:hypothetical protein